MSIYDNAGVALIPSGTKASKLYSVLPANGDGDFTHSRGSTATRVNKDGFIESVATNVPRLDYPLIDGVVQDCPALLLEPQRLNISKYSENFNLWSGGLVTADQAISPDGSLTADELTKTSAFSAQSRTETGTSGVNYVFSLFVKPKTTNRVTLRQASGSNDVRRYFDLSDESSGQSGGNQIGFVSEGIEKYPNGWYRIHTICTSGGTSISTNLYAGMAGNTTYDGQVYIWGSQLEQGDYLTSYVPNLSSGTTTRSADACNGSGTSAEFNSVEGVVFLEIKPIALDSTHKRITLSDSTSTNRIIMGIDSSNNVLGTVYNGSNQAILGGNYTGKDDVQKVALKYKANDFSLYFNGFEVATDPSGSTYSANTLNQFRFEDGNGSLDFYGIVKQAMTFKTALTDSELETLTSWDSFNAMATGQLYTIE
jgi:hypothetical protein